MSILSSIKKFAKNYRIFLAFIAGILLYCIAGKFLASYEFDIWDQQTWGYTAIFDSPFVVHMRNICQPGVSVYGPLADLFIDLESFITLTWEKIIIQKEVEICDLSPTYIVVRKALLAAVHFLFGVFLYRILKSRKNSKRQLVGLLFWLFNPVSLLVGTVWGQLDEVMIILTILSFYFLSRKKYIVSSIFLAFVVLFKAQGMIALPVFIFILGLDIFLKNDMKFNKAFFSKFYTGLSVSGFTFILTVLIISLPFYFHERESLLDSAYLNFRIFPFVHMRAFNLWMLTFGDLVQVKDENYFLNGLSYHTAGIYLFLLISANIFLIAFSKVVSKRKNLDYIFMLELVYLVNGTFFLFMTEIHERYVAYMYLPFLVFFILKFIENKVTFIESILAFVFTIVASFNLIYVLYYEKLVLNLGEFPLDSIARISSAIIIFIYLVSLLSLSRSIFSKP